MELELDFDDTPSCVSDCPDVGVHNTEFENYAKWRAVNSGVVKWMAVSPKHGHAALLGQIKSEDTRARKLGRAIHCAVLEPETFAERFVVAGKCQSVLKSGERKDQACGDQGSKFVGGKWLCGTHSKGMKTEETRDAITDKDAAACEQVKESLKNHPAMRLLARPGWSELSLVWEYEGLKCKCRLDRYAPEANGKPPLIIDVKKCRVGFGSHEECQRAIANYDYHIQAALYCKAVEKTYNVTPRFVWIFVEDGSPYDLTVVQAEPHDIELGWQMASNAMRHYASTVGTELFHGYMTTHGEFPRGGLPEWYVKKYQGESQ